MTVRLKKRAPYLAALLIFWLVVRVLVNPFSSDKLQLAGSLQDIIYARGDDRDAQVLVDGEAFEQPFTAVADDLCGVALRLQLDTDARGSLLAELAEDGTVIASVEADCSSWFNDETVVLYFPTQANTAGKDLTLRLTARDTEGSIGILLGLALEDGTRPIHLKTLTKSDRALRDYRLWWGALLLASFLLAFFADGTTPKTFLMFAGLSFLLIFINSTFPGEFDEWIHYLKAAAMSQGHPFERVQDGVIGLDVAVTRVDPTIKNLAASFSVPATTESSFVACSHVANVIPVGYIVPALGILIARLLGLGEAGMAYGGRIACWAFYTFFCYLALRKAKCWRGILFTVACLPICLRLGGMVSPDPILISTAMLFISICVSCRFADEKINRGNLIWLLVSALFFCSGKYLGYAPVALLALIIPKASFEGKGRRKRLMLLLFGMIALLAVAQILLLRRFPYVEERNGATDFFGQLQYMVTHVPQMVWLYLRYVLDSLPQHLTGLHANAFHSILASILEVGCLAGAVITNDKPVMPADRERRGLRALFIGLFGLMATLTIFSLYLAFTPVGVSRIDGVQTRYFLPALALLLMGLSMNRIRNDSRHFGDTLAFVLELAVLCTMMGNLLTAFDIAGV